MSNKNYTAGQRDPFTPYIGAIVRSPVKIGQIIGVTDSKTYTKDMGDVYSYPSYPSYPEYPSPYTLSTENQIINYFTLGL